jgi:hypothetical protein
MKHRCRFSVSVFLTVATLLAGVGYAPADDGWGTVKGRIVLDAAEAPAPKQIDVSSSADKAKCLAQGPLFSDELVVNKKNLGIRWVFVWLAPTAAGTKLPIHKDLVELKPKQVEIDQPCCAFIPHALALREGQDLVAKNSSPMTHNVNWTSIKNSGGNVIAPAQKSIVIPGLKADRYPVQLACNIHGWMKAYVRIFDHPYYAVTDQDGKFEIKLAPAGTAQLVVWHDSGWGPGGKLGNPIVIKSNEVTDLGDLKMKPAE